SVDVVNRYRQAKPADAIPAHHPRSRGATLGPAVCRRPLPASAGQRLRPRPCRRRKKRAESGALEAQNAAQRADAGSGADSQNVQETLKNTRRECVFAGNVAEAEYPRQESNL